MPYLGKKDKNIPFVLGLFFCTNILKYPILTLDFLSSFNVVNSSKWHLYIISSFVPILLLKLSAFHLFIGLKMSFQIHYQ